MSQQVLSKIVAKVSIDSIGVGDAYIKPAQNVRNLGSWFDKHMSMDIHVGKVCTKAFRGLYNIRQIRKFLSIESTKTFVHAFVTSHLHYYNSLLFGIRQYQIIRLQRVLNSAARITCFTPRCSHITLVLMHLHWLPIKFRVEFKIALLVYKSLNEMAPDYIADLLLEKPDCSYQLRSNDQGLIFIPKTRAKSLGNRAFVYAGPSTWNKLPYNIRNIKSIENLKSQLKTFLFKKAYYSNF